MNNSEMLVRSCECTLTIRLLKRFLANPGTQAAAPMWPFAVRHRSVGRGGPRCRVALPLRIPRSKMTYIFPGRRDIFFRPKSSPGGIRGLTWGVGDKGMSPLSREPKQVGTKSRTRSFRKTSDIRHSQNRPQRSPHRQNEFSTVAREQVVDWLSWWGGRRRSFVNRHSALLSR